MPVVSVSMPAELLDRLDTVADEYEYTGRSEVVREGARALLGEFDDERLDGRELAGIISVFSEYGDTNASHVTPLRHDHEGLIVSSDHSHVGSYCLDLFVLEGTLEEISAFVTTARAADGVETVEYSLVPLDGIGQIQLE